MFSCHFAFFPKCICRNFSKALSSLLTNGWTAFPFKAPHSVSTIPIMIIEYITQVSSGLITIIYFKTSLLILHLILLYLHGPQMFLSLHPLHRCRLQCKNLQLSVVSTAHHVVASSNLLLKKQQEK